MSTAISAIKDLLGIEKSLDSLRAEFHSKSARLDRAKSRKEFLLTAPRNCEDTIREIASYIDSCVSAFITDSAELKREFSQLAAPARPTHVHPFLFARSNAPGGPAMMASLHSFLCFALNHELKITVRAMCEAWDWSDAGPPLEERDAELKTLESEIFTLEVQVNEISNKASQMGIRL